MDDGNLDSTSTSNSDYSTQTNSVPVIATDQSLHTDEPPTCQVQPEEAELTADSSACAHSGSLEHLAPVDEADNSEETCLAEETAASEALSCDAASCDRDVTIFKVSLVHDQTPETSASEAPSCDTALCDKDVTSSKVVLIHDQPPETTASQAQSCDAVLCDGDVTSSKVSLVHNQIPETTASEALSWDAVSCGGDDTSSEVPLVLEQTTPGDDATSATLNGDILCENNQIDLANRNDHSPAYSNCANFDKTRYSVDFVAEDSSKIEKSDNLIASDLISSETMNDFFDEMYDMSYSNHYKPRKTEESSVALNSYSADLIDGNVKDQDWAASTLESDFCSPASQSGDSASIKSSLKRVGEAEPSKDYVPCKKAKKGITFDSVSVYYFPRTQGFTCIPSQGGSTLGMSWNHSHIRKFSLGEHAAEQRKAHRHLCSQQLDSSANWNEISNISSDDSDSDEIVSDSEVDYENYNFLQPIPTRERRAMLRAAGIHKIDSREKDECRTIRMSREFCGCTCQIYCDPERCVCAQAGIKCQVDRMNFPCSCTRDGCANENGRVEFNPMRVRTHFIHTLMRLEMEKKKEEEEEHNHRLLFGEPDNVAQLSYPAAALAQSSSAGVSGANLLTAFAYHPDSLPYYAQPPAPQPSLYDMSSATPAPGDSIQLPHPAFAYDGHQYSMAAVADEATYSQMSAVSGQMSAVSGQLSVVSGQMTSVSSQMTSSLTVLGENCASSLATGYAMSGNQCLRLAGADYQPVEALHQPAGFHEDAGAALRAAYHGVQPLFAEEETAPEAASSGLECHSEGETLETLDTSAEVSEETEKEESDVENFGDIIKKTMVESVIA